MPGDPASGPVAVEATLLERFGQLAAAHEVPMPDVLMIALNAYGLQNADGSGRVRCMVRLACARDHSFRSILASDRKESPFRFEDGELLCDSVVVGRIYSIEHDDARLGYFRESASVLTLNTNARSHCTGCVFCPNTGSDASDPKIDVRSDDLQVWLRLLLKKNARADLANLREVNLSTSCFGEEVAAIEHLEYIRGVFKDFDFQGRIGILSSVIRSPEGFDRLRRSVGSFALFLTLECVTQRSLWLKESKANLSAEAALEVLEQARLAQCDTGVTLVVGLDPIEALGAWLQRAAPLLTDFPNLQVFQVHSRFMASAGVMGDEPVVWFLEARRALAAVLLLRPDLRPSHWQNYRPFWYTEYQGSPLP